MINMNSSDKYKTEMESKRKRMVITGASGFVGSRLYDFFSKSGFGKSESECDYIVFAPTHNQMDIVEEKSVRTYMKEIHPDVVIHSAAISNTWVCEQHPELSLNVNVIGTVNIGTMCGELGSKLIFMSSDQVYNGEIGLHPHLETSPCASGTVPPQSSGPAVEGRIWLDLPCWLLESRGPRRPLP